MPDWTSWTPYLAAAFAAANAWLFKNQIQSGRDIVKLQTVMEYYVERQTKDAALRLEQLSNPTPPDKQVLLQKYRLGTLTEEERVELIGWLDKMRTDPDIDSAERSAALQITTGIMTTKLFQRKKRWWQLR